MNFIFKDNNILGPIADEDIISLINSGTLKLSDFVFDDNSKNWFQLFDLPLVKSSFKAEKPDSSPLNKKAIAVSKKEIQSLISMSGQTDLSLKVPKSFLEKDWYILRGKKKHGPFKYLDVVKMLNKKSLADHDMIWNKDFKSWNKISDLQAFSSYYINQVRQSYLPELGNIFFRRKFARKKISGKSFLHLNEDYWTGHLNEISPSGVSITMQQTDANLVPGDIVNLHIRPNENCEAFNTKSEIVSKWYRDKNFAQSPLCLSFKFNSIKDKDKKHLEIFCGENKIAA